MPFHSAAITGGAVALLGGLTVSAHVKAAPPALPSIPRSFRSELSLSTESITMKQIGAGHMIVDASAGPKGRLRSRACAD
eukprot:SAG11_NODE_7086_length_1196_cov_1.695533_2_plen_80_part_00